MRQLKELYHYKRKLKIAPFSLKEKRHANPFLDATLKVVRVRPFNILYVNSSLNNTLVTLTNLKGKVLLSKSCGSLGFKGKKKRTSKFAIKSTLDSIISVVKNYGSSRIILCLNGFAKARFSVINLLKANRLKILGIRDITPIPHNGCRARKLRRG